MALALFTAYAQTHDTIVFRDGTSAEAKITAVNPDNVEYYRADNLEGPKFTITKSRIAHIVFSNGHKETFHKVDGGGISEMSAGKPSGGISAGMAYGSPTKPRQTKTEEELIEAARRKKRFYAGFTAGGGLSYSDITGTTVDADKYYHNSAGYSVTLGVACDYYFRENSSWYIGGGAEIILEEPRMKATMSGITVISKLFNKNCMFSVHTGQHFFPQKKYGYGNFYWKAGLAAGFSFKGEGIIVVKANGNKEKQTVSEASRTGFQLRPIMEAGIGDYSAKIGIRYSPSITPMINIGGTDNSVHNISIIFTVVF